MKTALGVAAALIAILWTAPSLLADGEAEREASSLECSPAAVQAQVEECLRACDATLVECEILDRSADSCRVRVCYERDGEYEQCELVCSEADCSSASPLCDG